MNFVAIDFETASSHNVCAVGIITVKNGKIVDEYYSLVKPPKNYYDWFTIRVHGITPEMTKEAPDFATIYPEIQKRLQGQIVVAHNESFDRGVLRKSMIDYGIEDHSLNLLDKWKCTMLLCRANKKRYPAARLNVCCEVENIELNHHDALSDARACAKLYLINGNPTE